MQGWLRWACQCHAPRHASRRAGAIPPTSKAPASMLCFINSWPFRLSAHDLHAGDTQTCESLAGPSSVTVRDRRACEHGYMRALRSGVFDNIEAARN